MGYLIDTNVISELRKKNRCDRNVAAWQESVSGQDCYISAISMMEIRCGILTARGQNPSFAAILEDWYENQVKRTFSERVLSINLAVTERCATLLNMRTRGLADALIAATASVNNLTLATRNIADFQDCGVKISNPWESPHH